MVFLVTVSWSPPSVRESRYKDRNFRSCSSSDDSNEEVVVCDDDVLVAVKIFGTSIPRDKFLKAEVVQEEAILGANWILTR